MSLGEMQACFARLCVDETFRELFTLGARRALRGYSLSEREFAAIRAIDPVALSDFASSLASKRGRPIRAAYPLLFAVAEANAGRDLTRFHQTYTPAPYRHWSRDIIDFGRFVEESVAARDDPARWTADIARYERLTYCAFRGLIGAGAFETPASEAPGRTIAAPDAQPCLLPNVEIAAFDYDVSDIAGAQRRSEVDDAFAPAANRNWVAFIGAVGDAGARRLPINGHTAVVLTLCDGTRTVPEVVNATEAALKAPFLGPDVIEKIRRSVALNLVGWRSADVERRSWAHYGPARQEGM